MSIALCCFSPAGGALALRLQQQLTEQGEDAQAFASTAVARIVGLPDSGGVTAWTKEWFHRADALVYIGAAGIAVRAIAPQLASKLTDPAVLCLDEKGQYVIPLLSGHVGGANRLAKRLAAMLGAAAVITTATDVNGLFAVDDWIVRSGMCLRNAAAVRPFADALLAGREAGFQSEIPVQGSLPRGLVSAEQGEVGCIIGIHIRQPFRRTVVGVPRIVAAGIGCRRGVSCEQISGALEESLRENNIYPESLFALGSIDLKRDEEGLLALARRLNLPLRFFSADQLRGVAGEFTASERVLRVTGVDNVCERAAVALAGGPLIQRKRAQDGVTVALAVREMELTFEEETL